MWSFVYQLRREQVLPISRSKAWEFFSDPSNLPRITPPALGFQVADEKPERMTPGMIMVHRVSPVARIPITWVTEITQVIEPILFVDEQRFGPYRFWHHQHRFEEIEGGVRIIDIVHYAPPLGPFGAILNRLWIRPQLEGIFDYRRDILRQMFTSGNASAA